MVECWSRVQVGKRETGSHGRASEGAGGRVPPRPLTRVTGRAHAALTPNLGGPCHVPAQPRDTVSVTRTPGRGGQSARVTHGFLGSRFVNNSRISHFPRARGRARALASRRPVCAFPGDLPHSRSLSRPLLCARGRAGSCSCALWTRLRPGSPGRRSGAHTHACIGDVLTPTGPRSHRP